MHKFLSAPACSTHPLESSCDIQRSGWVIAYSSEYDDRPILVGMRGHSQTVSNSHPADVFTSITVPGRAPGPIPQSRSTMTQLRRSISIAPLGRIDPATLPQSFWRRCSINSSTPPGSIGRGRELCESSFCGSLPGHFVETFFCPTLDSQISKLTKWVCRRQILEGGFVKRPAEAGRIETEDTTIRSGGGLSRRTPAESIRVRRRNLMTPPDDERH